MADTATILTEDLAETPGTFKVEVLRVVACSVEVEADNAVEAAEKVAARDFPVPSVGESEVLDGWEYVVYRAGRDDEELYRKV